MTALLAYRHALCESLSGLDASEERNVVRRLIVRIDEVMGVDTNGS